MSKNKKQFIGGVLGGMGPLATVDFMSSVISLNPIETEKDHIHLIVDQNPHVPNRQIKTPAQRKKISSLLMDRAIKLEAAGADFLVMPCNTAHMFADAIKKVINIPFLHIVEETIAEILCYHSEKTTVGIMATSACLTSMIYQDGLINANRKFIVPSDCFQEKCMEIIFSIKDGRDIKFMQNEMQEIAEHLITMGAEIIIAGCTEIPLVIKDNDINIPLISSTEVLALKTIEFATGKDLKRVY
jgi:aspartate racemase